MKEKKLYKNLKNPRIHFFLFIKMILFLYLEISCCIVFNPAFNLMKFIYVLLLIKCMSSMKQEKWDKNKLISEKKHFSFQDTTVR